jgi:DNA polymerase-3 subunit alpha
MASEKFSHLHVHTEYSPQDAPVGVKSLVQRAKELGYKSLAVTDHGTISAWVKFALACKDAGIKPIFGIEGYFVENRFDKTGKRNNHHIILLAKNQIGMRNIQQMSQLAYEEGYHYDPRMDWKLLEKHAEGVICTSACVSGIVPETLRGDISRGIQPNYEAAKAYALRFQKIFADDFYLEIQSHGLDIETETYPGILALAKETGIKVVGTNDVHYINREDANHQETLMTFNMHRCIKEPTVDEAKQGRIRHDTNMFYLRGPDEMASLFDDGAAAEATVEIADKCVAEMKFGKTQLPSVVIQGFKDEFEYLKKLARDGMRRLGKEGIKEYEDRLHEELEVIGRLKEKGFMFDRYFLIVHDYVSEAQRRGIYVGVGRGSGAGSLVLYCLGITGIDPLPLDLLFERFLTEDRNEMPDIDVDFEHSRADEVFKYIKEKYGEGRCARIGTFHTFHVASSIKAAFKVFDPKGTYEKEQKAKQEAERPNDRAKASRRKEQREKIIDESARFANDVTGRLPKDPNSGTPSSKCTFNKAVADKNEDYFYVYQDEFFQELKTSLPAEFAFAEAIEGLVKERSKHAAGVIITEDPLVWVCPQQFVGSAKELATAFDMGDAEKLGLIKFDILSIKGLTVLAHAVRIIKARHGTDVDINHLPTDDPKALSMFTKGDTLGIFQFESDGMRRLLKDMEADCFEDVIAANALYRPGPADNIPIYVACKHDTSKVKYPVASLETTLKPTYGIMVYQEQVMKITRILAGFSVSEADKVRKAMGKKKKEILDQMRDKFIEGTQKNKTCSEGIAKDLWSQMEKFGSYAFNKAHAAGYAYIAYQCAWLKAHYPAELMAAQLSVEGADSKYEVVAKYEHGLRDMKIDLLPIDINKSKADYVVENNGSKVALRKGFKGIKGIGAIAYESIVANQPYKDMFAYCAKAGPGAKSDVVQALIDVGSFDFLLPGMKKKKGRDMTRPDIFADYLDQAKRAANERNQKGARKEEMEGMGVVFGAEEPSQAGSLSESYSF